MTLEEMLGICRTFATHQMPSSILIEVELRWAEGCRLKVTLPFLPTPAPPAEPPTAQAQPGGARPAGRR